MTSDTGAVGAVIVAAGASTRMGPGADKTLADLGGEPLIARTVAAFEQCDAIAVIVVVAGAGNRDAIAALRVDKGWRKTAPPILGGARRQDSVRIGLAALPPECAWVVVHDGARPFVTAQMIEEGRRAADETGAAVAVVPAYDTVKRVDASGRVVETLDRSELAMVQTPQVFRRDLLERAHAEVTEDVTDDAAMVERTEVEVRTFDGDRGNIKITTPTDLALAEAMIAEIAETGAKNSLRSPLQSVELGVRMMHIDEHGADFALIDEVCNHIVQGFPKLHYISSLESEMTKQEGRVLLAARAFKALRSAGILCQYGLYEQALVLVRVGMQHLLVAYDIENREDTFQALRSGKSFNTSELNTKAMIRRVAETPPSPNFRSVWEKADDYFNEYVHPGGTTRQKLRHKQPSSGYSVSLGCYYDPNFAPLTLFFIERGLLDLMLLVLRIKGFNWDVEQVYQRLVDAYEAKPLFGGH